MSTPEEDPDIIPLPVHEISEAEYPVPESMLEWEAVNIPDPPPDPPHPEQI